jgi:hypothetical protein
MKLWKSIPVAALAFLAPSVASVGYSQDVKAKEHCRSVHAKVRTDITTENCQSPVGLCTKGHIEGGPFHAATAFLTLNIAPSAGMPGTEPAENFSYSGFFHATQDNGSFVASDLGVLDVSHSAFTELSRSVSGTGKFANPTGTLVISGALVNNATGFDGFADGTLCTDRDDDD